MVRPETAKFKYLMLIKAIVSRPLFYILLLFLLLTVLATFPLVFRIKSVIPGFEYTDEPFSALWNFWWLKFSFIQHLDGARYTTVAAPFGMDGRSGYPLWNFINQWLSIITDNVVAYNIEVLFSFIAAAFFTYLLTFYITRNKAAGIISGIIYAFCPYHFVRSWQHLGLAQIQWIPLYALALLKFNECPDKKRALYLALAFLLVASFDYYYTYFMVLVTIGSAIFFLSCKNNFNNKSKAKTMVQMFILFGFLAFLFTLPVTIMVLRAFLSQPANPAAAFNSFSRPFEDLFGQSARPLSYILPATVHPVLGSFTERFVGTYLYGSSFTEHTLFLGWGALFLASMSLRKRLMIVHSRVPSEIFHLKYFIFLGVFAWFCSQPPWWNIGPVKIYMPSFFMYKLLPMFRAYCRFGIIVMLAVAVLAGMGLKIVLGRFKSPKTQKLTILFFCCLVLFEFWNYPPYKVIDVSGAPPVYEWIKAQPGEITIAEYPLDTQGPNGLYGFFQTFHHKKIINCTVPGTYPNQFARSIVKLSSPRTASMLAWMGVKYVVLHREDYIKSELLEDEEELNNIPKNSGLKFIRSFPAQVAKGVGVGSVMNTGPIDVYEVSASRLSH